MIDLDLLRCRLKAEQARMMNIAADARRVITAAEASIECTDATLAICHRPDDDDGVTELRTSINEADAELLVNALMQYATFLNSQDALISQLPGVIQVATSRARKLHLDKLQSLEHRLRDFVMTCDNYRSVETHPPGKPPAVE